uniref:BART domain-containing protein n=1 Tax=Meloidogyne javanica TaxID=6303 RepID=A0A915M5E2_MELJA
MNNQHFQQSPPEATDEGEVEMAEVATEEGVELTAEEELRKKIDDTCKKIGQQFTFLKDIEDTIGKEYVSKLSSTYEGVYCQTHDFLEDFAIFKDLKEKMPTLPQRNQHRLRETNEWRDFAKKQFKVVSVFLKDTFYNDFDTFYDDFAMLVGYEKSVEILSALRTFLKDLFFLLNFVS